jgi:hypothetical protein
MNKLIRLWHSIDGHPYDKSIRLDKLQTEKHPHSDNEMIFTINIMKCECGLTWLDTGLEYRDKILSRKASMRKEE